MTKSHKLKLDTLTELVESIIGRESMKDGLTTKSIIFALSQIGEYFTNIELETKTMIFFTMADKAVLFLPYTLEPPEYSVKELENVIEVIKKGRGHVETTEVLEQFMVESED